MIFVLLNHCLKHIYCILTINNPEVHFLVTHIILCVESHLPCVKSLSSSLTLEERDFISFFSKWFRILSPEQSVCWGVLARSKRLKSLTLQKRTTPRCLIPWVDAITTMQLCKIKVAFKVSILFKRFARVPLFCREHNTAGKCEKQGTSRKLATKLPHVYLCDEI